MTSPALPKGLAEIADRYDVLLCDVWGVIHNGRESFPAPCEALTRFGRDHGAVILISNSPRPREAATDQLRELGVPDAAWSAFVTSGDATRALLAERAASGPAWLIGPERDNGLYDGLGLTAAGPETAVFISCSGLVNDDVETPEDYRAALGTAAARGLTMICANPDRVVRRGDSLIYCAGALADLYQTLGGEVLMAGKPHGPIYRLALQEAASLGFSDQRRILCIGDGLPTDVMGANGAGLDCLFIAGGIHGALLADGRGGLDEARVDTFLAEEGAHAAFAMLDLVW